jgi:predicted HTH transcriptional regulator
LLAESRHGDLVLIVLLLAVLAVGVTAILLMAVRYGEELRQIAERPRYTQSSPEALQNLIRQGEQDRLEFKSTMRWNLRTNRAGKEITHAWLKTVAAFLNSDGGTLLIGIEDDGNVLGIEADQFESEDKCLLHFNNLIKERIGLEFAGLIDFAIRPVDDKQILVVDCEPSARPVFLNWDGDEEFYVRVGPGSRQLPASKTIEYLKSR